MGIHAYDDGEQITIWWGWGSERYTRCLGKGRTLREAKAEAVEQLAKDLDDMRKLRTVNKLRKITKVERVG